MPHVSTEQIDKAKSVNILSYLQAYEAHNLIKQGHDRFCLRDHDSLVISNNKWHWFSQDFGGYNALDFLIKVRGFGFVDAVLHLTDGTNTFHLSPPSMPKREKPQMPFTLPTANANNDHAIAYLRGRGIDKDIIMACVRAGTLYESRGKSCVFVGFDGDTPRFACERSIMGDMKRDVSGSNKRYGFVLPPQIPGSCSLVVAESPIDILSHACIHKLDGNKWDGYRLSLGGVSNLALKSFLERHPEIDHVWLSLDNDKAGMEATIRIIREFLTDKRYSHLKITVQPPPFGKDFNDTLGVVQQLNKEKALSDRQHKAVNFI